jgi:subtilisin family serine protease
MIPRFRFRGLGWTALAASGIGLLISPSSAQIGAQPRLTGRILVVYEGDERANVVRNMLTANGVKSTVANAALNMHVVNLPAQAGLYQSMETLRKTPGVKIVEPEIAFPPSAAVAVNDPMASSQWHLSKIKAPDAWNTTTGSSSVIIAILDTGVDGTHPDLAAKMVPGWNTFDNNSNSADVYGHGTAVAGTAAAIGNNKVGVASPAWGCKIMPVRISDANGMGYSSTIATGLTWAADHGARVANISYAVSNSLIVQDAAKYFASKGGVVTVSAGNANTFDSTADAPNILTVSATDSADSKASFTNTGNNIDLAAPGVSITTTNRGGGYGSWSGTSFSAPLTAGVAALVISAKPGLTGAEAADIVRKSTDDLGSKGWDAVYGFGRLNAAKAVEAAGGQPSDTLPPVVTFASPGEGNQLAGTVPVNISATDNKSTPSVTLFVDGKAVSSSAGPVYSFTWDSKSVANGSHKFKAEASDGAGNKSTAELTIAVNNVSDSVAPTVRITSPTGGNIRNSFIVSATATDNIGVARIELYTDGKLAGSTPKSLGTFSVNSSSWSLGNHTLYCLAYDAAGNVAKSLPVVITKK